MKHYLMTTSYRGPEYPIEANRRRIAILRGITARSLASQGFDFTWLALVNRDDPLLGERLDAFRSAGQPVVPCFDDCADGIDWSGDVLTTRIDDDDAFARGAFLRLRRAVVPGERRAYIFPKGYRVNGTGSLPVTNRKNAWASLMAPAGDRIHVRAVQHRRVWTLAPVTFLGERPTFLWVRHQDTETAFRGTRDPLTPALEALFDVDWDLIRAVGA